MKSKAFRYIRGCLMALLCCFPMAPVVAEDGDAGPFSEASSTISVTIPERIAVRVTKITRKVDSRTDGRALEIRSNFAPLVRVPAFASVKLPGGAYEIMTIRKAGSVTFVVLPR